MLSGAIYNDYSKSYLNKGTINGDNNGNLREPEVILVIKRLQEQVILLLFISLKRNFFSRVLNF